MEEIMDYNEYVNKVKSHKNSSIDKLSSLLDSYISSEDSEINLGNESFKDKYYDLLNKLKVRLNVITSVDTINMSTNEIKEITEKLELLEKIETELSKMNKGSIALCRSNYYN